MRWFCDNCGFKNDWESKYCQECGWKFTDNKIKGPAKDKVIRDTALGLGFWGIINLLYAPLGGVILVFFAILIYASKSIKAILAFGIVWLIVASVQLLLAIEEDSYLIIFAIINLAVAGYIIYKSRQYAD